MNIITIFYSLVISQLSFSSEPIIVSAKRPLSELEKTPGSVIELSQQEIEDSHLSFVNTLLKNHSGIYTQASSSSAQNSSLFIRGADSGQILVLVDGVPFNDPSTPTNQVDFSKLSTLNVKEIKVLKGAQSVLYGADALGGVILITTNKGSKKSHQEASVSYSTLKESHIKVSTQAPLSEQLNYSLAMEGLDFRGQSTAKGGSEIDERQLYNFNGSLLYYLPKNAELTLSSQFLNDEVDLDNGGGSANDDPNYVSRTKRFMLSSQLKFNLFDYKLENKVLIGITKIHRIFDNPSETVGGQGQYDSYQGEKSKFSWDSGLFLINNHKTSFGLDYDYERDESSSNTLTKRTLHSSGLYLQHTYSPSPFFIDLGGRYEHNQIFDSSFTYKVGPGIFIKESQTKFWLATSSSVKNPTLFQLYSIYGNEALNPEKSQSYEIGWYQKLFSKIEIETVFFNTLYSSLIEFNNVSNRYFNQGRSRIYGLESSFSYALTKYFKIWANYTKTQTKALETNKELYRRPHDQFSGKANYHFPSKTSLQGEVQYTGRRDDQNPYTFSRQGMSSFMLFNFEIQQNFQYPINGWIRLENILNKDYEEVAGFSTPGRTLKLGIHYRY